MMLRSTQDVSKDIRLFHHLVLILGKQSVPYIGRHLDAKHYRPGIQSVSERQQEQEPEGKHERECEHTQADRQSAHT